MTDKAAVYFTNGVASVNYDAHLSGVSKMSASRLGYFFRAGLAYNIAKNVTATFEYNVQPVSLKTPDSNIGYKAKISTANLVWLIIFSGKFCGKESASDMVAGPFLLDYLMEISSKKPKLINFFSLHDIF